MKSVIVRWVKRVIIGLAIIMCLLAVVPVSYLLFERHRYAQFNRTVDAPLKVDPGNLVLADAHKLLNFLGAPTGTNSLQFAAMPSFSERWFAVSLSEREGESPVRVLIYSRTTGKFYRRDFALPTAEARTFFQEWDSVIDGYAGEPRLLTDGNPLAFERRFPSSVSSGEGNSPCHYDVLGGIAARHLTRNAPELADLRTINEGKLLRSKTCDTSILNLR